MATRVSMPGVLARALAVVVAGFLMLLSVVTAADGAHAAPGDPDPVSTRHVWVDPSGFSSGDTVFVVDIELAAPPDRWVAHATAPDLTDDVIHCSLTWTDPVLTYACSGTGDLVPGDYDALVDIQTLDGVVASFLVPITICPLTGCSALFAFTLEPAAWQVCPGEQLSTQGAIAYRFNVAWNATAVEFGELGGGTPGHSETLAATSGDLGDGETFALAGALHQPGDYTLPVTMTDEFGTDHSAVLSLEVLDPSNGACGGALPATGFDGGLARALALGAALTGAVGAAIAAITARTRPRTAA